MDLADLAMLTVMGGVLHSFLYRFRGGYPSTGSTQLVRLIYSLGVGLGIFLLLPGIPYQHLLMVPLLTFLGLLIPHGNAYDMGRQHDSFGEDFALMFSVGFTRASLIVLPLTMFYPLAVVFPVIIGMLHSISYEIGWRLPYNRNIGIIDAPTAWGELIFGFLSGAVGAYGLLTTHLL